MQLRARRMSSTSRHPRAPSPRVSHHKEMHQVVPREGFFDKTVRVANQTVGLLGTAKGVYEAGRYVYGVAQAARPLLALL